jgi:eukaryotic-like serine/threonine-protein kinase
MSGVKGSEDQNVAPASAAPENSQGAPIVSLVPPPPGSSTTLGKHRLLAHIGQGGMSDVFLALASGPNGFNKLVVLKRQLAGLATDVLSREMFLDEGKLAARLNHPNVVQTNEVGEDDGVRYMVMEYLEGQSLAKVVRRLRELDRTLPQHFWLHMVSNVLSGIHYAHTLKDYDGGALNIVHRDLSPHNIFITYDGAVNVLDFGVAKADNNSAKTEVGTIKGKLAYMAPEQINGELDRRADIFVIGIVLWELLLQRRMERATSELKALTDLISSEPVTRMSSIDSYVSSELDNIVATALEKDPSKRFQSAQEMREAIDAYSARSGLRVSQEDIGALMSDIFKEKRDQVTRLVQGFIRNPSPPNSEVRPLPSTNEVWGGSPSSAGSPLPTGTLVSPSLADRSSRAPAPLPFAPPPTARLNKVTLAVALVAVALALVAVFARRSSDEPRPSSVATGEHLPPIPSSVVSVTTSASIVSVTSATGATSATFSATQPHPPAPRWGRPGAPAPGGAVPQPVATPSVSMRRDVPTPPTTASAHGRVFRTDL